jgi:Domain of unknown function (DUF4160)
MPTISRFYGIVIAMYFGDHPPPHFHAWYAGHKGRIAIESGEPIDGDLPPRARRLIREWCQLRRDALNGNWRRVEAELPLLPVEPLP